MPTVISDVELWVIELDGVLHLTTPLVVNRATGRGLPGAVDPEPVLVIGPGAVLGVRMDLPAPRRVGWEEGR